MTPCEATAILTYLEYNLLILSEDFEQMVNTPDDKQKIYELTYAFLQEFERTLATQVMLDSAASSKK